MWGQLGALCVVTRADAQVQESLASMFRSRSAHGRARTGGAQGGAQGAAGGNRRPGYVYVSEILQSWVHSTHGPAGMDADGERLRNGATRAGRVAACDADALHILWRALYRGGGCRRRTQGDCLRPRSRWAVKLVNRRRGGFAALHTSGGHADRNAAPWQWRCFVQVLRRRLLANRVSGCMRCIDVIRAGGRSRSHATCAEVSL